MKKRLHTTPIYAALFCSLLGSGIYAEGFDISGGDNKFIRDDFNFLVDHITDPLAEIGFINRKINEISIGIFNPNTVPAFPQYDYSSKKSDYEFKNFVTFGDSMHDRGTKTRSTMFLAGGYRHQLATDYLSAHYTGKGSVPATFGGLNYAEAGAAAKDHRGNGLTIRNQIDRYLARNGGSADGDSIYTINAGAIDISDSFNQLVSNYLKGSYHFNDEFYTLDNAPQVLAEDVTYLNGRGARYIMVGNVPDSSLTPYTPMIPVEMASNFLNKLYLPNFGLITHVGKLLDLYLRNPANQLPGRNGVEVIRNNQFASLKAILWFLPSPLTTNIYNFFINVQHSSTEQFNRSLELALANAGTDVVFLDQNKLFLEIVRDYKAFGFDDVVLPTCDLGFSSRYCEYDSPRYHKDRVYLYGDWFHPSPEAHFVLAQYMQSVFDAPLYIGAISEYWTAINKSKNDYLSNQLLAIRKLDNAMSGDNWRVFAGYAGMVNDQSYKKQQLDVKKSYTNTLNIGFYTFTNPETALGLMFTAGFGKQKPFHNFNFKAYAESLTLFSQWHNDAGLWVDSYADFGYMRVKDATRSIQLGALTRTEKADASDAYSYGIAAKGGYDWIVRDGFKSGPQAELNLNRVNVKSLKEQGDDSTAMRFRNYHANDFYANLGWYINTGDKFTIKDLPANLQAELNYGHKIGDHKTKVRGGLNSTATSFIRELETQKQWLELQLNANIKVKDSGVLSTNAGFKFDNKSNKQLSYGVGYRYQF